MILCYVTIILSTLECIQDLDLRKPGVRKPPKRVEFQVKTEEVLRKADFRVSIPEFHLPCHFTKSPFSFIMGLGLKHGRN